MTTTSNKPNLHALDKGLCENKGLYRVSCGYWYGRSGQRVPRVFTLGPVKDEAENLAYRLKQVWQFMSERSPGLGLWTTHWERFARDLHALDLRGQSQRMETTKELHDYFEHWQRARVWEEGDELPIGLPHPSGEVARALGTVNRRAEIAEQRLEAERQRKPTGYPAPHPATSHEEARVMAPQATHTQAPPSIKLYQAIDDYLEVLKLRVPNQLSESNYERQCFSLNDLRRWHEDVPLDAIGYDQLCKIVAYYTARPPTKRSEKMAVDTVTTTTKHIGNLFAYLQRSAKWNPAPYWERTFKIYKSKLMTQAEKKKAARGVDTYEPEELAAIWKAGEFRKGDDQCRLYLALGLNILATQKQLGQLLLDDIHLDAEEPFIEFARGKTGVYAYYRLWPITADLLRERLAQTPRGKKNPEGLALLTRDGHSLVRYNANGSKIDSVRMSWARCLDRAKLADGTALSDERKLGYKYLRKTSATEVLRRTDEATQQQALAHASNTVAGRHYTGKHEFTRMNDALWAYWEEKLKAIFVLP